MRRSLRASGLLVAAALLCALAAPGPAVAGTFSKLYQDYGNDGHIQDCTYSSGQLRNAAGNIPPDVQAYDPGFGDEVNRSLGAGCGGSAPTTATAVTPPAPPGPSPTQLRKADRKRTKHVAVDGSPKPVLVAKPVLPTSAPVLDSNQRVPFALLAMAAALGVLILTGGGMALGRYLGWDLARASGPAGRRGLRGRAGDALADLRDRFRR
jgi:hypothetical protein